MYRCFKTKPEEKNQRKFLSGAYERACEVPNAVEKGIEVHRAVTGPAACPVYYYQAYGLLISKEACKVGPVTVVSALAAQKTKNRDQASELPVVVFMLT